MNSKRSPDGGKYAVLRVEGERELPRLGETVEARKQPAAEERDHLVEHHRRDQRRGIAQEIQKLSAFELAARLPAQCDADGPERHGDREPKGDEDGVRIAQQHGGAQHPDKAHRVLDDDDPGVHPVEEAGTGQGTA